MAKQCFIKKKSNPPMCGVHNVALIERESSDDSAVSRFGDFTFLVCPVSGQILDDDETRK
jgi:hypothetical protein